MVGWGIVAAGALAATISLSASSPPVGSTHQLGDSSGSAALTPAPPLAGVFFSLQYIVPV